MPGLVIALSYVRLTDQILVIHLSFPFMQESRSYAPWSRLWSIPSLAFVPIDVCLRSIGMVWHVIALAVYAWLEAMYMARRAVVRSICLEHCSASHTSNAGESRVASTLGVCPAYSPNIPCSPAFVIACEAFALRSRTDARFSVCLPASLGRDALSRGVRCGRVSMELYGCCGTNNPYGR